MSVHRLRQQFYGLPADERLFYERWKKKPFASLGHAFGLVQEFRMRDALLQLDRTG